LLLLLNIAYFAWQAWHFSSATEVSHSAANASSPNLANDLLLLREIDPSELKLRTAFLEQSQSEQGKAPDVSSSPEPESIPKPPVTETTEVAETKARVCYRLGPLLKKKKIDGLQKWLKKQDITAILRRNQRYEVSLHWVYFPPFQDHAEAQKQAKRMKGKGIRDIYVLSRGDMSHAISLGVFSQRASMEKRIAELKKQGYTPSVGTRSQVQKATFFTAVLKPGTAFPKANFDKKFPSLGMTSTNCPSPQKP